MTEVRCAAASLARAEPLLGTGSTVRAFLLVEHPGPWGVSVLRDSRMSEALRSGLAARSAATGVRVLLSRRHRRREAREGTRVFAAYADPERPWLESVVLDREEDVLDLDLEALGGGRSPGLEPTARRLLCVCTHGRHDACCAERGRPVASALARVAPEDTWEVSHVGGDRFAANVVVLPDGLYYGRLDPDSAVRVAEATGRGLLDLDHLRGRSSLPTPVQAAEVYLRRELGELRIDAVRLVRVRREDDQVVVAQFRVAEADHTVRVRRLPGEVPHRLTCQATRAGLAPRFELVEVVSASRPPAP